MLGVEDENCDNYLGQPNCANLSPSIHFPVCRKKYWICTLFGNTLNSTGPKSRCLENKNFYMRKSNDTLQSDDIVALHRVSEKRNLGQLLRYHISATLMYVKTYLDIYLRTGKGQTF